MPYAAILAPTLKLSEGISPPVMRKEFRGECTYLSEIDTHFPHLTVSQTLAVAEATRLSKSPNASSRKTARGTQSPEDPVRTLDLARTLDVKVGNDFILGISGGERKRTSIAEILVGRSLLQCWDNSTKGLDTKNALRFIRALRQRTRSTGTVSIATLYQASQDIYDIFDKVLVLYEGYQIFFGSTAVAKSYFTNIGFIVPDRMATSDFLTSLTNPPERIVKDGYVDRVPRTPLDFARVWQGSAERAELLRSIDQYWSKYPIGQTHQSEFRAAQKARKSQFQSPQSPYNIVYIRQILVCITRGFQRLRNDLIPPVSSIVGNAILSILLGSVFYNLADDSGSFFSRGIALFFIVLTNTFLGAFEGVQLWDHRPIVEKHFQYASYHPSAEAVASMICDLPNKILLTTFFNIPFYFLANMRRTLGAFLVFYLFTFVSLLTGSMLFRTIGALSKSLTSSIAPGASFVLMLVIYTGFVLPVPDMPVWFRWFTYLNPISYTFESLMVNEFSNRQFICSTFVPEGPSYQSVSYNERECAVVGAEKGSSTVDGDKYLAETFQYYHHNIWRNLGFTLLIMFGLCGLYLLATEWMTGQRSKRDVLIFPRGLVPGRSQKSDEESIGSADNGDLAFRVEKTGPPSPPIDEGLTSGRTDAATFLWDHLRYEVKTKKGAKRLLDDVEGWVRSGTLTALMGESGAGKLPSGLDLYRK